MLAGEQQDLTVLGQLCEQVQDHRQTVIVKGQQRVVQDKRTGLGRGEDQVRHRQTEGQVELVGGALAQERQGAVGQGAGLPDGDVETAVQGHLENLPWVSCWKYPAAVWLSWGENRAWS